MRNAQDSLTRWVSPPAQFERRANVLADNDNEALGTDLRVVPEELPSVSWLSFY